MTVVELTRAEVRSELNKRILQVQEMLVSEHGYRYHRLGEWLNSETGRHVRMGYASDEWNVFVSDYPSGGYGGVAQLKMRPVRTLRLDARGYDSQRPVPTVADLLNQILQ